MFRTLRTTVIPMKIRSLSKSSLDHRRGPFLARTENGIQPTRYVHPCFWLLGLLDVNPHVNSTSAVKITNRTALACRDGRRARRASSSPVVTQVPSPWWQARRSRRVQ